jgi:hypothetical protein
MTMTKLLSALLCGIALSGSALADTCLNTDKYKYADNDPRSSDYGKCKPAPGTPDKSYNSLNAIGSQMQGMMQRREEEKNAENRAREADRESRRADVEEWDRNRFKNLQHVTAKSTIPSNYTSNVAVYANAGITPEQQRSIREEIGNAISSKQLLEKYGNEGHENAWASNADAAKNWKTCEVATQLVRAYVYGNFIDAAQKDPAKGFAIARAGCDAHCGGTCYWLGRIYEDGNDAAPGVDKVLGKQPQTEMLRVYDNAIVNGVTAAYERAARINWVPPERYREKKYFDFSDFEFTYYWYDIGDYRRLAYAQYKRCLDWEPANLACAQGINALVKDTQSNNYVWRDELKEINADGKIAYYQEYQARLEGLLNTQKTAAKP